MFNAIDSLGNTDSFVVVLVRITSKSLELSTLFPSYKGFKIIGRVAVGIIISYQPIFVKKNSAPNADSEESTLSAEKECYSIMILLYLYILSKY